jgi:hypothetical protein
MIDAHVLVSIGVFAILYLILCNRAISLVHPLRMEMLELGERLLADHRLRDDEAKAVETGIAYAYSSWIAWAFVVGLPVAAIATIIDRVRGRENPLSCGERDLQNDLNRFLRLATVSLLANSPLAAFLFVIVFVACSILFLPIGNAVQEMMRVLSLAQLGERFRHRIAH